MSAAATEFTRLNADWNAEPNAPDPRATVVGTELVLEFAPNPFLYKRFSPDQRVRLIFSGTWRYRMGSVNDEGWYGGQCRFSRLAPTWGEFYEVRGDLRLALCPNDWICLASEPPPSSRHFLFYFRDEEFECDAVAWRFVE